MYAKSLQLELLSKASNSLGLLTSLSFSIFMPAEPPKYWMANSRVIYPWSSIASVNLISEYPLINCDSDCCLYCWLFVLGVLDHLKCHLSQIKIAWALSALLLQLLTILNSDHLKDDSDYEMEDKNLKNKQNNNNSFL